MELFLILISLILESISTTILLPLYAPLGVVIKSSSQQWILIASLISLRRISQMLFTPFATNWLGLHYENSRMWLFLASLFQSVIAASFVIYMDKIETLYLIAVHIIWGLISTITVTTSKQVCTNLELQDPYSLFRTLRFRSSWIGQVFGPIVSGVLYDHFGERAPFIFLCTVGIFVCLIFLIYACCICTPQVPADAEILNDLLLIQGSGEEEEEGEETDDNGNNHDDAVSIASYQQYPYYSQRTTPMSSLSSSLAQPSPSLSFSTLLSRWCKSLCQLGPIVLVLLVISWSLLASGMEYALLIKDATNSLSPKWIGLLLGGFSFLYYLSLKLFAKIWLILVERLSDRWLYFVFAIFVFSITLPWHFLFHLSWKVSLPDVYLTFLLYGILCSSTALLDTLSIPIFADIIQLPSGSLGSEKARFIRLFHCYEMLRALGTGIGPILVQGMEFTNIGVSGYFLSGTFIGLFVFIPSLVYIQRYPLPQPKTAAQWIAFHHTVEISTQHLRRRRRIRRITRRTRRQRERERNHDVLLLHQ